MSSYRCGQAPFAIDSGKDVLGYEKRAHGLVDCQEQHENAKAVSDFGDAPTARKERQNRPDEPDGEPVGRVG
eukprot:CAMPEP_0201240642 /NCGR_PEP_ID=MMETSP0852-20130820/30587_1 /ASSEMBLY_ACC=CAM_ASM_000632 /TAXON_ID=183588 /ORGANISM="Pseudo-nitzschia fraudulenta, Strain WWA7" /LENGTH=71 /DNA_ID=CAMNT_0047536559 /DNA_START=315 /DNA_END=526 /DNA_ORIENTATION=-